MITSLIASTTMLLYPEIIIKSISSLSLSIYNLRSLSTDKELEQIILSSDIINDIVLIKNFIEDRNDSLTLNNKTIILCIDKLNMTIIDLETNIQLVIKKIEYNKSVWFSYFRSYNIKEDKEKIILLIQQLKHRFDMMVKMLNITSEN
jgi:hypothetical protein